MKEIPSYFAYFAFLPRFENIDFLADHNPMIRFGIFFYLKTIKKYEKCFGTFRAFSDKEVIAGHMKKLQPDF